MRSRACSLPRAAVPLERGRAAAAGHELRALAELGDERLHPLAPAQELGGPRVDAGNELGHLPRPYTRDRSPEKPRDFRS